MIPFPLIDDGLEAGRLFKSYFSPSIFPSAHNTYINLKGIIRLTEIIFVKDIRTLSDISTILDYI